MPQTPHITYEQPANELIRTCLRLEHLFAKMAHHCRSDTIWNGYASIETLVEIMNVVDRPDLKALLSKELGRQHKHLQSLQQQPHVDPTKLDHILTALDRNLTDINNIRGKLGQTLKEDEFLTLMRMRTSNLGGACAFDTPCLHAWLHQPYAQRCADLDRFLQQIASLQESIRLIMQLVRDSPTQEPHIATKGHFQLSLDPKTPYQLIRVEIPTHSNTYPEISLGPHRLCIRFLQANLRAHTTQVDCDINFNLMRC